VSQTLRIAPHLKLDRHGILLAGRREQISHPDDCQDWYRQVEDSSYWFGHRAACIVECLRRFPPGGTLVDIGGGNGHVAAALDRHGFPAGLIEPSLAAAQHARRRGVRPVVCATLEEAGLAPQSLAAAGLFDVLEHIEGDRELLLNLRSRLQDRGRLYLTVPAYGTLWSAHDERVGHFRRYRLGRLVRLLTACGFEVQYATYLFALLVPPIWLCRSLPHRFGRSSTSNRDRFAREHDAGRGGLQHVVRQVLRWEQRRVARGKTIPFGSSCLVVARRL